MNQPQILLKILLLGDLVLDEYVYGNINRLSPEAPIPVFEPVSKTTLGGMSSNVKANLAALNIDCDFITVNCGTKSRYIDLKLKQHILRIDNEHPVEPLSLDTVDYSIYDVIVVLDYNKGFVSLELLKYITLFRTPYIFIDTKKLDLSALSADNVFIKINNLEYNNCISLASNTIRTLGDEGCIYKDILYPGIPVNVLDVCGAGDTFLAALVYKFIVSNFDIIEAIKFANIAAAVTVQHVGVYAPTLKEINEIIRTS